MNNFSITAVFTHPGYGLKGNTAAVIYLDQLPEKGVMQQLAAEINQPATTFLAPAGSPGSYDIRWFAPDAEIGLCGHGSLAAVAFLRSEKTVHLHAGKDTITGRMHGNDSASISLAPIGVEAAEAPDGLESALETTVLEYYTSANKSIVVIESSQVLKEMIPDFAALKRIPVFGYAVTAPDNDVDFTSRTLVPHVAQLEDHATGSSHAILGPYWSKRLSKYSLEAIQHSPRGGYFSLEVSPELVNLRGKFTHALQGRVSHS